MPLAPPENEQSFESLEDLILRVNEHAASEGYAVVLFRIKKSKLKIIRKAWLICDRGRKICESAGRGRRNTTSRHIECSFSLIGKLEDGCWNLKMINGTHNHGSTLAGAHLVHRKIAMNSEMQSEIIRQLKVQIAPAKVLTNLRVPDSVIGVDDNYENLQLINPFLKSRDIYNFKAQKRREALGSLTSVQALIRKLNEDSD